MSGRDFLSGAQKRKKRELSATHHEEFIAKVPKLTAFFNRRQTSDAADTQD